MFSSGRDFNPRTPVGCDLLAADDLAATPLISIHAPQWGATLVRPVSGLLTVDFNPRTPVGCDQNDCRVFVIVRISIHAPQWGATTAWFTNGLAIEISIHAPQWGATTDPLRSVWPKLFQSTHPSGVRRGMNGRLSLWQRLFQSTHPSGVRLETRLAGEAVHGISIHAPQWGATRYAPPLFR